MEAAQNSRPGVEERGLVSRAGCLGDGFSGGGQAHHKERAAVRLVPASDLAVMVLNRAVHGAEAQASAFPDGLGGVKGIEDTLRVDQPWTIVGEFKHSFAALAAASNFQLSAPGFLQGVHRILDKFDEDLE